jgi:hypothetical protein
VPTVVEPLSVLAQEVSRVAKGEFDQSSSPNKYCPQQIYEINCFGKYQNR